MSIEPTIVNLNLTYDILYHQRRGIFKNGLDKPNYNFAYFSRSCPHYKSDKMNVYKYKVNDVIPNMIKLDDDFWPEDLYEWASKKLGRHINKNAYELNDIIIRELGYSGWFFDTTYSNEYVLSKDIIDGYLELVDETINDDREPDEEADGEYYF